MSISSAEEGMFVQNKEKQQAPRERPTMELRWLVKRQVSPAPTGRSALGSDRGTVTIVRTLQQKWAVAEFKDGQWVPRYEWRDIPEISE